MITIARARLLWRIVYRTGVVVTAGHAFEFYHYHYVGEPDPVRHCVSAALVGIVWPFYWSGWIWSHFA